MISGLGDKAHLQYAGVTVFNNQARELDISSWSIDDEFTAEMKALLVQSGREATAAPATPRMRDVLIGMGATSISDGLAADLVEAGRQSGADLVLLLAKGSESTCELASAVQIRGIGLCLRGVALSDRLFASPSSNVTLIAFDPVTRRVAGALPLSERGSAMMDRAGVIGMELGFPPDIDGFDDERAQAALKRFTTTLTRRNITKGLREMGLAKPAG